MSKHYELTTLQDVFDLVPADKIEFCLREIGEGLAKSKLMVAEMKSLLGDEWRDEMLQMRWPMTWIDDEGGHGEILFYSKETGDHLGSIPIDIKDQG